MCEEESGGTGADYGDAEVVAVFVRRDTITAVVVVGVVIVVIACC